MNNSDTNLYLGTLRASVEGRFLCISQSDRRRHLYTIGQTGSGKTTFLKFCILQDVLAGRGFAIIDPHGDLADDIINSIPRSRVRDVVYLNPSDTDHPIGFNPFQGISREHQPFVASNILSTMRSIWRDS